MRFDHERGTWIDDPDAQGYYEVKTWWRTFDDFVAWTKSRDFDSRAFQAKLEDLSVEIHFDAGTDAYA